MSKQLIFSFVMLGSIFIAACSQILLKKAAVKTYASKIKEYLNVPVIAAYSIFFLSWMITAYSLKYVPLSIAPILESTSFVFVSVMGKIFLGERFSNRKLLGLFVLTAGVIIASL